MYKLDKIFVDMFQILVKSNISPEPCTTEINLFIYSGMPDSHTYPVII